MAHCWDEREATQAPAAAPMIGQWASATELAASADEGQEIHGGGQEGGPTSGGLRGGVLMMET